MTVTYTSEVSTSSGFGCFLKLLLRWKGSIYKLVWFDLIVYLLAYYMINLTYRFGLEGANKATFEFVIQYCETYGNLIPLSFVLGFYVNLVMTRWWNQYTSIPYPDNLSILVSAIVKGEEERSRVIRRTIMRYVCLTFAMTMTMISASTKKRFPTLDHFVESGLMHRDEKRIMESMDDEYPSYAKYWLPLAWASNITTKARQEGIIRDDISVKEILREINIFRTRCGTLLDYDIISIPLVYTQVVTLAIYSYFLTALIGRQSLTVYFPILTVLEYFFYVGWLKVAETMINPFGDDDDDFEVFWMVDRHLQVSYLIIDKIHHEYPKLIRDQYWVRTAPNVLPYTLASEKYFKEYPQPSTSNLKINPGESEMLFPDERKITDEGVDGSFHLQKRKSSFFTRMFNKKGQRNTNVSHRLSKINDSTIAMPGRSSEEEHSKVNSDWTEFNKLKQERALQQRKKIETVLQLLKNQGADKTKTNTL